MKPCTFVLLLLVLAAGCQQKAKHPPESLAEARNKFTTKLLMQNSAGQPLPDPPPELFQKVEYDTALGKMGAYLTPDPKDGKKHPAIVWITGGDCSTIDEGVWEDSPASNDQTARQYREAGIMMMYPTQRGGNQNPGFHEAFYGEIDDVLAAAEFLSKQEYVDPQRIYLGGHSSGGTTVLLAAECSSRFRAVFSVGPSHDLHEFPPQFDQVFKTFDFANEMEYELRNPALWLHSIKSPVFVFAGTVNDGALSSLRVMKAKSKNSKIQFYEVVGANHFDICAPTNQLIAQKILADTGPECSITFTAEELNKPFAR